MTNITMCMECGQGYHHNYNGVVLCAYCGQPKEEPDPEPLRSAPAKKATPRRKRTTDE